MTLADAVAADRAGDLEAAAAAYEGLLASGDRSELILVNLALLYWQATDPGMAASMGLGHDFMTLSGRRIAELLDEAVESFPRSTAVQFWTRYIAWTDLGEPLDAGECKRLLHEDPETLVPVMWIFAESKGREMKAEACKLLEHCREDGTVGARYVVSVIEGVMARSIQNR